MWDTREDAGSGVVWVRIASSTFCSTPDADPATAARYARLSFVASVFPAPLSPDTMSDWSLPSKRIPRYALSARAYTCGGSSVEPRCEYLWTTDGVYSGSGLNGLTDTRMEPTAV